MSRENVYIWTMGKDYILGHVIQERDRNVRKSHMIGHEV